MGYDRDEEIERPKLPQDPTQDSANGLREKRNGTYASVPALNSSFDGYFRHAQHVRYLALLQPRGVVLEGKAIELLVDAEAAQSVRVGEYTQCAKLFGTERYLQIVGYFDQSHVGIIAARSLPRRVVVSFA